MSGTPLALGKFLSSWVKKAARVAEDTDPETGPVYTLLMLQGSSVLAGGSVELKGKMVSVPGDLSSSVLSQYPGLSQQAALNLLDVGTWT